ncbi:MAG: hypothetical protein ACRDTN_17880, partial [Mycobacterium sp.]
GYVAVIEESVMELSLRPGITVAAVVTAGVIVVTPAAPPPLPDIRVPAIELSASAGPLADLPGSLPIADVSGLLDPSGLPGLDALLDAGSGLSSLDDTIQTALISVITSLASITISAGVTLSELIGFPFGLQGFAMAYVGTALATLGGVFTPISTAVLDFGGLSMRTGELIAAAGGAISRGLVTPIYDILVKLVSLGSALVSGAASTSSVEPVVGLPDGVFSGQDSGVEALSADLSTLLSGGDLSDLTQSLDPGAALDFSQLLPDLLTVF